MKIVRSIVAIVVGWIVSGVVTLGIEMTNFIVYAPADGKSLMERMKEMEEHPATVKAWLETLPTTAMVIVLLGWQAGAFFGGGISALIAGRARLLHAGIIGGLVLASTVFNLFKVLRQFDFAHPDWMIIAGLLLPLPVSLLAGKLVTKCCPTPPTSNP